MNRSEIMKFLSTHKAELKQKFQVTKIGLFGSYAKDDQTPKSDIDFYVEFAKNSFDNLTGLYLYLEKHFQKKIDIVYRHPNNNKSLIENIQKEVYFG